MQTTDRNPGSTAAVSVIIPTFNRSGYLRVALKSILNQTVPPSQIIVVNDGSTDDTESVVRSFGSIVHCITTSNSGKSAALNLALPKTIGEFIWIFDDDDIADPLSLGKFVDALRERPECGFAYGHYDHFSDDDGERPTRCRAVALPHVPEESLHLAVMERCFIFQPGMLVRKSCYDAIGIFNENLLRSQDYEMLLRITRRYTGTKVDGIVFHQRQHSGTRGTSAVRIRPEENSRRWMEYDQRFFRAIYCERSLAEYLPGGCSAIAPDDELALTALLQRCCIMGRKGLWDFAAQDLEQAADLARKRGIRRLTRPQRSILRRMLDGYSYGLANMATAKAFRQVLNGMESGGIGDDVRSALIWPLPHVAKRKLRKRQYSSAYDAAAAYLSLSSTRASARMIFEKIMERINNSAEPVY